MVRFRNNEVNFEVTCDGHQKPLKGLLTYFVPILIIFDTLENSKTNSEKLDQ